MDISSLHKGFNNKEFSVLDIVNQYIDRIEKKDKDIHAYLDVFSKEAQDHAKELDKRLSQGESASGLFGVPLAIKDNLLLKGHPTTAASKMLDSYVASYDATVVDRLKREDVIFLGKTNLDEFAMGSSTEYSYKGETRNPHDLERIPGGSSGGSAAAVAADMALVSLGSDTGGSIRQPASFCGVVGLKPTYGAVSRYGLIALASSLDQIGPFSHSVSDAAQVLKSIAGADVYDATTSDKANTWEEVDTYDEKETQSMTIGVPKEYMSGDIDKDVQEEIEEALNVFKKAGIKVKEVSLPHTRYAVSVYYIILPAEASSNLARFDGIRYGKIPFDGSLQETYLHQRGEGFGDEVKRRILLGTFVLSSGYYDAYYAKAQKVRAKISQDFESVFKDVDVLFAPTTPSKAFLKGEKINDPLAMYLADIFTIPANLAGVPALSLPSRKYKEGELPVGFQLIGKRWHERDILSLGRFFETHS